MAIEKVKLNSVEIEYYAMQKGLNSTLLKLKHFIFWEHLIDLQKNWGIKNYVFAVQFTSWKNRYLFAVPYQIKLNKPGTSDPQISLRALKFEKESKNLVFLIQTYWGKGLLRNFPKWKFHERVNLFAI